MAINTVKQEDTLLKEKPAPSSETFVSPQADVSSSLRRPPGSGGGGGGGSGGGGGGGGGEESATNNLSFPVIWSEGTALVQSIPVTDFSFTTPYDVSGDGAITDADKIDGYFQFAQKVPGNLWQAGTYTAMAGQTINVSGIDWGDSLESRPLSVGKPVRVELTLYKDLISGDIVDANGNSVTSLTTFPMKVLANPSSPNEVQGAGATAYPIDDITTVEDDRLNAVAGTEATVYSPETRLVIQQLVGEVPQEGYLVWNDNDNKWTDPDPNDAIGVKEPLTGLTFAGELNVGGKVIYGLSEGGWKPTSAGKYRITFDLPLDGNAQLDLADVINVGGEGETGYAKPQILANNTANLSYVDVLVVAGGGGGRRPLSELTPFEIGNNHNLNPLMAGVNPLVPQI